MKVYLIFLGEGRPGTSPYGQVDREPRLTTAETVPPQMGYSPAVSEHSRQSPGLVTGSVDIPNMANNEPGPGSFHRIRSKRR